MIDSILQKRNAPLRFTITFKSALSFILIILAVALPQIVHLAAGSTGGTVYLPMYIPVVLGGLLLGWKWGLGIGILSPIVSYLITAGTGNAMPAAYRLPYMIAELAVFASVSGAFSKLSSKNPLWGYVGAILAVIAGRLTFLGLAYAFQGISTITGTLAYSQILSSWPGMLIIAAILPTISLILYPLGRSE